MSGHRLKARGDEAVSALQEALSKFDETINSSFDTSIVESEPDRDSNASKRIKLAESPEHQMSVLKNELIKKQAKLVALETDREMQLPLYERDSILKQNQIQQLKKDLDNALKEKERLENKLKQTQIVASKQRDELTEKNDKLRIEVLELRKKLDDLEKQRNNTIAQSEKERADERKRKLDDEKRIYELQRQLIDVQESHADVLERNRTLTESQEKRNSEYDALLSEQISLKTQVFELQNFINEANWSMDLIKNAKDLEEKMKIMAQWEQELIKLRKENEKLRTDRSNTTLMREKLLLLESVNESANKSLQRCSELECDLDVSQRLCNEWEQALVKLDGSLTSPQAVVKRIRKLQDNELCLLEEKHRLETELALLKNGQRLINEDQKTIKRLERKILLLTRERDSYKSVLDSYESDVTINPVTIQSKKASALEALLEDYRQLTTDLEAGGCQKSKLTTTVEIQTDSDDQFMHDPNQGLRLIHFKLNPLDVAHNERMVQLKEIEKENGILRAKIKTLEERGTIEGVGDTTLATLVSDDPRKLKSELEAAQKRQERIMAAFKKTSKEFRQAVYCLTGYRIDMRANRCVLRHVYSEFPEDQLEFEIGDNGFLNLLSNNYSLRLEELTSNYLQKLDSIPAFLSAHTLQLFNSQTMMQMEQPSMFVVD